MTQRIYLDHAASSPLLPEVIDTMMATMQSINGNPSSTHREGVIARNIIEESRKVLAQFLHTSPSQIFFTSGATESNNIVIQSIIRSGTVEHIIYSPLEHPSILNAINHYCKNNSISLHPLHPNEFGAIDLNELDEILMNCGKNSMVSLMHTHNVLGTILPISEVSEICKRHGVIFHSDTVQSIGLLDINVTEIGLSSIIGSGHKFNGPKGIGFMYLKDPTHTIPMIMGGSQERNIRAGTENIVGITGMIKAIELAKINKEARLKHIEFLHQKLRNGLIERGLTNQFNTPTSNYLPKILSAYFEERKEIDWLLMNLDIEGVAVSGGSACASGSEKASHINEYLRPNTKGKSVRFSISHLNTEEEINQTLNILTKILN
ncbi:MAG: cysteine desulfurase family protein [Saprospiraceae bacterium]